MNTLAIAMLDYDKRMQDAERVPTGDDYNHLIGLILRSDTAEAERPRVVVTVSDGLIGFYADQPIEARVIDYDTDGSAREDLRDIYTDIGLVGEALVHDHSDDVGVDPKWIAQLFALEPSE